MLAEVLDQFAAEPAPTPAPAARVKAGSVKPKLRVVKSDASAILAVIGTAALDPSVPVEKMNLLREMHREAKREDTEKAFAIAMGAAQDEMGPIRANAVNDAFDSQYATYAALDAVMRPIYRAHDLTVRFTTKPSSLPLHQRVVVIVKHVDGYEESSEADFPSDGTDDTGQQVQTLTHAAASALTYGQRYMLAYAFNIAIAKDRDGNVVAGPAEAITGAQVAELAFLIDSTGGDEPGLLAVLGVRDLASIPSTKFDHAKWLVANRKAA